MNNLEELLEQLPPTYHWMPLQITKYGKYWVVQYESLIGIEKESLKEAVERILELIKS